ncbi:hypothetical protein GKQ23_10265 [Erwinia sp. E602]|uniref:hypothetical protein n=1 Tax=Erwinia sp. E602 TaxID=2675378 RepID=UPI001BA8C800|nr:hypothetical protein [Erwinia sp. E602]QUG75343.1 hypothetical protein GKQ23_10265 [Erwinia sp. E602]
MNNKNKGFATLLTLLLPVLAGCSADGKLRMGEPPQDGVINYIETRYPALAGGMVSSWPYATLHSDGTVFTKLKKYCADQQALFENPVSGVGWCLSSEEVPLFIFYNDPAGGTAIRERSTKTTPTEWLSYTQKQFAPLWNLHRLKPGQ